MVCYFVTDDRKVDESVEKPYDGNLDAKMEEAKGDITKIWFRAIPHRNT